MTENSTFAERAKEAGDREERPKRIGPSMRAGLDAPQPDIVVRRNRQQGDRVRRITVGGDDDVTVTEVEA